MRARKRGSVGRLRTRWKDVVEKYAEHLLLSSVSRIDIDKNELAINYLKS